MVIIFFVTSADSGARVIDIITAGGTTDAPAIQRAVWAMLGGLIIGGLEALQTAAIISALPFALGRLVIAWDSIADCDKSIQPRAIALRDTFVAAVTGPRASRDMAILAGNQTNHEVDNEHDRKAR